MLPFLLCFFHGKDEVRHACSVFVEEEHVQVQRNDVVGMKTSGVLLKVFKEVMRKDLVEECGAFLEFVDVHLFHCDANDLLAAVLSCLPDFVVFGANFVDGLCLLHLDYCCIFDNLVLPEDKAFGNGKCIAFVVCHVGGLRLHNPYDMMKAISPVIEDGLQDVKELFLQSEKVLIIQLANDGRLGVQIILEEL
jgi:hypothetical protein